MSGVLEHDLHTMSRQVPCAVLTLKWCAAVVAAVVASERWLRGCAYLHVHGVGDECARVRGQGRGRGDQGRLGHIRHRILPGRGRVVAHLSCGQNHHGTHTHTIRSHRGLGRTPTSSHSRSVGVTGLDTKDCRASIYPCKLA
jgi:hypothetical protein